MAAAAAAAAAQTSTPGEDRLDMGSVQLDALGIRPEGCIVDVIVAAAVGVEGLPGAPCLVLWRLRKHSNMCDHHSQLDMLTPSSPLALDVLMVDTSAGGWRQSVRQTIPRRAASSCQ